VNLSVIGVFSMVTGFGSRPILPRRRRCLQPNFDHHVSITITLIYFVYYLIIDCVKKHKIIGGENKQWVGEDEEEAGVDRGLETDLLATCHLGRDQDGSTGEASAGGYIIRTYKQTSHRFLDRQLSHQYFQQHSSPPLLQFPLQFQ